MDPHRFDLALETSPDGAVVLDVVDGDVEGESDAGVKLAKTNQAKAAGGEEK